MLQPEHARITAPFLPLFNLHFNLVLNLHFNLTLNLHLNLAFSLLAYLLNFTRW